MKGKVRSLMVGAAALSVAGISVLAGGGAALAAGGGSSTPPVWYTQYTTTTAPIGGITFYNAQGQVVTGGDITANGLGAYAVADSADPLAPHTKATLFIDTPTQGENPLVWPSTQISGSSTYPATTAPAPIGTTTNPVETNPGTDQSVQSAIEANPNTDTSTTDGYGNLYDVRLRVSGGTGGSTTEFWDAVISVNITAGTTSAPTAGTWSIDYPAFTQNTTTTLTATPASPQTTTTPTAIALNAEVSPATAGTVSFWNGTTQVGTTQTVTGTSGAASVSTTPPAGATTTYTAVFTPAVGSADIGSSASLNYVVQVPADTTTTTLTETGSAAGAPVSFVATVTDETNSANNPVTTGTVSFFPTGSTTPLGTSNVSSTPGQFDLSFTYPAGGNYSVTAVYTPPAGSTEYDGSTSAAVPFTLTAAQCTTCTDVQTIEGTVPAGTLAVYTPFTASNPLNLGTLALNGEGTFFSASAEMDPTSTDAPTAGAIPDGTFNGITVVDTQAGNVPWTVTALASALTGTVPGSSISGENVGLTGLTAVPVTGNALVPADLTFTNQPAAAPPVGPTDTGDLGLGGTAAHTIIVDANQADGTIGINGLVTLEAPTSTPAGLYVGTLTFTIAS